MVLCRDDASTLVGASPWGVELKHPDVRPRPHLFWHVATRARLAIVSVAYTSVRLTPQLRGVAASQRNGRRAHAIHGMEPTFERQRFLVRRGSSHDLSPFSECLSDAGRGVDAVAERGS